MSSKIVKKINAKHSDFGQRLKEVFNNSTNQAIAEKLDVSNPAITSYMQGRIPPAEKLIEIAKITDCDLNWLLSGERITTNATQIPRPQGIIFQGSKGGVGTTVCAIFTALNLSLKGHKVLLVEDSSQIFSVLLNPQTYFSRLKTRFRETKVLYSPYDSYIETSNQNLDFFIFRNSIHCLADEQNKKDFRFTYSEIQKKYEYVIFDVGIGKNPFYYSDSAVLENFYLEPILRSAAVVVPFDVVQSYIHNVETTIQLIEKQRDIYPQAKFLGIFLNEQAKLNKAYQKRSRENLEQLKNKFRTQIFQTKIDHHSTFLSLGEDLHKVLFSRKTNIYTNFSAFTDELIEKLNK